VAECRLSLPDCRGCLPEPGSDALSEIYRFAGVECGSGSDIHDFDFARERASLRIEHPPRPGEYLHGGLQVFWEHTDSLALLSRNVQFDCVSPVPARIDERTLGVTGDRFRAGSGHDQARGHAGIDEIAWSAFALSSRRYR
jgi:hypothetical protein